MRQARRKAARRTVLGRGRRGGAISVTRDPPNDAVAGRAREAKYGYPVTEREVAGSIQTN